MATADPAPASQGPRYAPEVPYLEVPNMAPQHPKLASIPMARNQQEMRVDGLPLQNVTPVHGGGLSSVSGSGMDKMYSQASSGPAFSINAMLKPPSSDVPHLSPAEAINQTESIFRRCNLNQPVTGTANKQEVYNNMPKSLLRIVVIGDIHEEWNLVEDKLALQFLQPDLVLFTGDIGNENVELVRSVASLEMPKAVILGNHDSWGTQKFSTKIKDNIQLQLECLGEEHVGYSRLDFPMLKLSVVGGRPFSCGGEQLFRKKLLTKRYGIKDMDGSAKQISKAALGTPEDHLVIILAHNGPTGLGSNTNDICGRDWVDGGGDHGDPDLAQAISHLKETTELSIPLVVFGHMHKELAHGNRKMTVAGDDNTMYVNGAIVPRVKKLVDEQGISNKGTIRAFTVVEFFNGRLSKIAEIWVSVIRDQTTLEDEQILFTIDEPSV